MTPSAITSVELPLTPDGTHVWRPFGPVSTVECDLEASGWQWTGHGYFDANFGTRALEQDFAYWTWGRFPAAGGATCFYDATRLKGGELARRSTSNRMGRPAKSACRRSARSAGRSGRSGARRAEMRAASHVRS